MSDKERTDAAGTIAGQEWQQRFLDLVAIWKQERGPYSSSARLAEHPAYQQIVAMGPEVVPLLLRELEREPDHWFRALHALTGADPVLAANRGKIPEMAENWLNWGREHALEGLCGPAYGIVVQFLRRPLAQP